MNLREQIREAMLAQGKVDPEEVFREAEQIDLDDHEPYRPSAWDERDDPEHEAPPVDPEQEPFALDELEEDRGYTYEP